MSEVNSLPGKKTAKRSMELAKNEEKNQEDISLSKKQKGVVKINDQGKGKRREEVEGPDEEDLDEEEMGDEEEDLEDEEDIEEEEEEEDEGSGSEESNPDEPPKEFKSRSFVVLKTDFKKGEDYAIWKIDGNSLLQKYTPFKHSDGTTLFKSTSVYSGWAPNHKNNYYPAPTVFKWLDKNETVVDFLKDKVKLDESE